MARARHTRGPQRVQPTSQPASATAVAIAGAAAVGAARPPGPSVPGILLPVGLPGLRSRERESEGVEDLLPPPRPRAPVEFRVSPRPEQEQPRPARAPVDALGRKPHASPMVTVRPYPSANFKRPMASQAEHRFRFASTQPGTRAREGVRRKARRVAYNRLVPVSLRRGQLQASERA